jgi:cytochrome c-type protein NapC
MRLGETLRGWWRLATSPARHLSLAFLTLGGFLAGVMFWGGFNTALEATNTERFCVSCHEMRDNVFEELKGTIHYANRSGVRATSKEVWGHLFGSISTRDKFLGLRRTLAEHEWERMKANDSLECRNCHGAESMDITRQGARAASAHERFLFTGQRTCIDCHKGIAHQLPDMSGVPGWN